MSNADRAAPETPACVAQAALILESHARVVGKPLLSVHGSALEQAQALYRAPLVVLSHGLGQDPVFNYGNALAQQLFELDLAGLLALPSRLSAEPVNQAERQRLLDAVSTRGFIDDYAGVRISSSGKRFRIVNATVWNLIDAAGERRGQAACFATWQPL